MSGGYLAVSLLDMIEEIGEVETRVILSDFSCPLNRDVEKFLLGRNAIDLAKQNISPTQLVFTSFRGEIRLIGYYTLTVKSFCIAPSTLSVNLKKKINKFGTYDKLQKTYRVPAPLIAQIGKNFTDNLNELITGAELLDMAVQKVSIAQQSVGGKVVYLECEDKPKLIDFYGNNGFVEFDKRLLGRDEVADLDGSYLIQMLRII